MFLSGLLILTSLFPRSEKVEIFVGPNYSSYLLFQDTTESIGKWNIGGEIGINNIIPHIGLKLRGTMLRYDAPAEQGPYAWEYTPLSLCASFDILPFLKTPWMRLSIETGLGLYFWRGLYDDEIIVLPTGDTVEDTDIGFVGGLTLQIRPMKYLGIEYAMRYNYIASTDINKYGFFDKDDKIWENGVGIKFILPL
ncbi:MAG: hypothetical protein JSV53_09540 [candidate division WOR-3 bacterium]|nr:MAG: hypothetical protein JSV53_09540 [candidate division WOR-3 bacterium]